jgi:hypothetical protein
LGDSQVENYFGAKLCATKEELELGIVGAGGRLQPTQRGCHIGATSPNQTSARINTIPFVAFKTLPPESSFSHHQQDQNGEAMARSFVEIGNNRHRMIVLLGFVLF